MFNRKQRSQIRVTASEFGQGITSFLTKKRNSQSKKELLINMNRFAKSLPIVVALIPLFVLPAPAQAQSSLSGAVTPNAASPATQPKGDSLLADDFSGLNYTDEQKAEIDKIHRETESNKAAVVSDTRLNEDQKNAMLVGYTRMEYGRTFRSLSPEQQRQVSQRILARRAEDHAAHRKQPPAQLRSGQPLQGNTPGR